MKIHLGSTLPANPDRGYQAQDYTLCSATLFPAQSLRLSNDMTAVTCRKCRAMLDRARRMS